MPVEEVRRLNQDGWDRRVAEGDVWTRPVSARETDRARSGDWARSLIARLGFPAAPFSSAVQ